MQKSNLKNSNQNQKALVTSNKEKKDKNGKKSGLKVAMKVVKIGWWIWKFLDIFSE
ncbi:hypothetical protein [Pseudoalteromonas phenolica]|uniref:hypothetical protein n=1 Tax=Pseudoalteromonas phenolica TaxID=161398 RepID=UPI0013EEC57C|nr:hypothetical protein [Pseudoalteromonas phenolica]